MADQEGDLEEENTVVTMLGGAATAGRPGLRARIRDRWSGRDSTEQVRAVFGLVGLANLALMVPVVLQAGGPLPSPVSLCAGALVAYLWWVGVRRRRFPVWVDAVEFVALVALGLGGGQAAPILGPVYAAIFLRSLYGRHVAAFLRNAGYVAVVALLAYLMPSNEPSQQPAAIVAWLAPSVALTTVMTRILASCLAQMADTRRIDELLKQTAGRLLAAVTASQVRDAVQDGAKALLGPTAAVSMSPDTAPSADRQPPGAVTVRCGGEGGRDHVLRVATTTAPSSSELAALHALATQATAALQSVVLRTELDRRATHDALTGLPNRTFFTELLKNTLRGSDRQVAALVVDLDNFKAVNDAHGHHTGDHLLTEVVARLDACVGEREVLARIAADEFALVVDGVTGVREAVAIATRVVDALDRPYLVGEELTHVPASVGVAVTDAAAVQEPEAAAQDLLRHAGLAMYVAKSGGGNRYVVFTEDMAEPIASDRIIREELSAALRRDELVLFFQPVLCASSGRIQFLEALVRWQHPERGLLLPGAFLQDADRVGLLAEIEQWVITAACGAAAAWDGDAPPAVSVNVSAHHLAQSWLVRSVEEALESSGLSGERLIIEVTEESVVRDPKGAAENLRRCTALGVPVAIDDFGAGHTSMRHLTALPVSILKLDRSLLAKDAGVPAMRPIIQLAHTLDLTVVAEGVEEVAQLDWLRANGCDAVQGFLLGRPAPAADLAIGYGRAGVQWGELAAL